MLGVHHGAESHSVGDAQTTGGGFGGFSTHMTINFDHDVDDGGAWDSWLISDTGGRYFYKTLEFPLPTQSVFAFPYDSPLHLITDFGAAISAYVRDQLIIVPADPVNRAPRYETSVTLVYCDRWVKQETATMYRREERSTL